jgi:hypothetical protein
MTEEKTAYHEAGHAVLHIFLTLGLKRVTIVPNHAEGEAGATWHGGKYPNPDTDEDADMLAIVAPEAFWLRHATAAYAGAEACRRAGVEDWRAGADDDYRVAVDAINRITDDEASIDCLYELAQRRVVLLVEHYWPEIEAIARALLERKNLSGEEARRIAVDSLNERRGALWTW